MTTSFGDGFHYSQGAIASLAEHYHDERRDVLAIDAYADFERALHWLACQAPELVLLLRRLMVGYNESDLALYYHLRPRTLARLLDQTFLLLACYLNDEYPLEIPVLDALQVLDRPYVPPQAPLSALLIAMTSLSMSFFVGG